MGVLLIVGILNYLDRELPFILAESMKADLHLSDTQVGLITGFGFLLVYAVMGLPLARLSDKGAYGLVISGSVVFWSLMTAAGGLCQNFWQLAFSRAGVALGESGSTPAAHAYISRSFAPNRRGLPLALVSVAAPIGSTLGLIVGGVLEDAVGWRGTLFWMGGVGLLLGLVVPFVVKSGSPAPSAPMTDKPAAGRGMLDGVQQLLANRSYRRVILAAALVSFASYGIAAFAPALFRRIYEMGPKEVGLTYGVVKGVLAVGGLIIAGFLADRLARRSAAWLPRMPVFIIAISLPITMMTWLVDDKNVAIFALAAANAVGLAYLAPTVASVQSLAPPHLRATASAFFLFANAMAGGAGPLVVGRISDVLTQGGMGPEALKQALLVAPAAHVLAGLAYWRATKDFERDVYREAAA